MEDLSSYNALYISTSKANIEGIKNGLDILAKNKTNKPAMEEVFRNAHTLKSKSLMMGQEDISQVAKTIEDTLYDVMNTKNTLSQEILQKLVSQAAQIEEILEQVEDAHKNKI